MKRRFFLFAVIVLMVAFGCSCERPYVQVYDGRNPIKRVICPDNTECLSCNYEMTQTSAVFTIVFGIPEKK